MNIGQFLKDKMEIIISAVVFQVVIALMGYAFKLHGQYLLGISVVFWVLVFINITVELIKKRSFYDDFLGKLEQLDQKYLITEMLQSPGFLEGEILCESLYDIDKSMKERINAIEEAQMEFKEYVELWIHEIKVPISTLSCMNYNEKQGETSVSLNEAGFSSDEQSSSGRKEELQRQKRQIDKLNYYVEQILFLARADNPQKDYLMKQVSLEHVVNQVIRSNKELLRGNHISIEKQELTPQVMSDAKWLEFMIGQIVNNSVKYLTDGKKANIGFWAREDDHKVELVIEDNGIGVCKKDLPRVFEKTFTGENGRKVTGSTGMGLYICKKLCEKLGHHIWMESVEGEYTRVHLEFGRDEFYQME